MKNKLKQYAKTFIQYQDKLNTYLNEKVIKQQLEKEVRNFFLKHKVDPNEKEINEMRKNIVMKKGLRVFAVIFICFGLLVFGI